MRRIIRTALPPATQTVLDDWQKKANKKRVAEALNIESEWKRARQARPLKKALSVLKTMAGERKRCTYCVDSHGTDVEHFWPKAPYPERMYSWPNLLLRGCEEIVASGLQRGEAGAQLPECTW